MSRLPDQAGLIAKTGLIGRGPAGQGSRAQHGRNGRISLHDNLSACPTDRQEGPASAEDRNAAVSGWSAVVDSAAVGAERPDRHRPGQMQS